MAYDVPTLDTSTREKLRQTIASLTDAGLSMPEIADYFARAQALGRSSLQDYFNQAGTAIGLQFQPEMQRAANFLGSNPLLADSGYANRLNRTLASDIYSRIASDYGQQASQQSMSNLDFLRSLYERRAGLRAGLVGQGYGAAQKKQKVGSQLLGAVSQLGGAAIGGIFARPRQAPSEPNPALASPMPASPYSPYDWTRRAQNAGY